MEITIELMHYEVPAKLQSTQDDRKKLKMSNDDGSTDLYKSEIHSSNDLVNACGHDNKLMQIDVSSMETYIQRSLQTHNNILSSVKDQLDQINSDQKNTRTLQRGPRGGFHGNMGNHPQSRQSV